VSLRLGVVQFELRPERSFAEFATHVEHVVDGAAAAGVELVVLPELVSTGLLASHRSAARLTRADMPEVYHTLFPAHTEAFIELARSLAMRKGLSICSGSHYRAADDGTFRNTGYLAHPDGRVDAQDKLHLTPAEHAIDTTPGDDVGITTVGPARVAIQICADIEFPEVTRHLALKGVDLVLCPSLTWNRGGAHRVRYSCLSRSVENQLFVACAPLLGTCDVPSDGAIHGTGRAFVSCPIDRIFGVHDGLLVQAKTSGEEVVVTDLDIELLRRSRAEPSPAGLSSRRPELYERLSSDRSVIG
jgi:predicted amidohydrolase